MKKLFFTALAVILLAASCNNETLESDLDGPNRDRKQLEALVESLKFPPQVYAVDSKERITIKGQKGTLIHFDPAALETIDGSPIGDSVRVELLELQSNIDMALQGIQTTSDSSLLVSGGAYYLNMYSGNTVLRIKEGEEINVEFPRFSEDEMALFLGESDGDGQINWKETNQTFQSKNNERPEEPEQPVNLKEDSIIISEAGSRKYVPRESEIVIEPVDDDYELAAANYRKKLEEGKKISEKEYNTYIKKKTEYERRLEEFTEQYKLYRAVTIRRFGNQRLKY